jgi:signal transduction histidine kinase
MVIRDDGQSFSVAAVLRAHGRKRLGLLGMKERMRIIGGTIDIASSPRKGTTIVAVLPLSKIGRNIVKRKSRVRYFSNAVVAHTDL